MKNKEEGGGIKEGAWFDGPYKLEQLARGLLWFPGMSVLEISPRPSSFELAKLLHMKFFHLEMSTKQLALNQTLAAKLEVNASSALWEKREKVLGEWPNLDALVLRNVCGIPMDVLKTLVTKLVCPASLLLVWPVCLQRVSASWEKTWRQPLWTPNELLYQLRGLRLECMDFECQPFVPEKESSEVLLQNLKAQKAADEEVTEKDLLLTAYALIAATSLVNENKAA